MTSLVLQFWRERKKERKKESEREQFLFGLFTFSFALLLEEEEVSRVQLPNACDTDIYRTWDS
jgi:hypothetical protein